MDIDAVLDEIYQPLEPMRADEFTVDQAAARWKITPQSASAVIKQRLKEGVLTRRPGRSETGRKTYYYSKA